MYRLVTTGMCRAHRRGDLRLRLVDQFYFPDFSGHGTGIHDPPSLFEISWGRAAVGRHRINIALPVPTKSECTEGFGVAGFFGVGDPGLPDVAKKTIHCLH